MNLSKLKNLEKYLNVKLNKYRKGRELKVDNKTVAEFMINEIIEKKYAYQEYLVHDIRTKFGDEFVYENENGNLAISKNVLKEFKKLKEENGIEWDRSDKSWVKR